MINILLWMLVLGPHLLTITDGCGRVPATPAPTTVPPTPTEQTINGSVRALKCTPEEVGKTKCLNNGTCFVLKVAEDRIASCHCPRIYKGLRCEYQDIDQLTILEPNHIATAGIAASIAVLVIIMIVFTTVAIVYYRRKRRRRADQERVKKTNGGCGANNILLPENNVIPPSYSPFHNRNGKLENHINLDENKLMLQGYKTTPV